MNKCTDGKQITYSDVSCEKLGLTVSGSINKDYVTIVPAAPVPVSPSRASTNNNTRETVAPAANDIQNAYQCTTANGLVTFSSTPCPKTGMLPQGYYAPIQQESVTREQACDAIKANGYSSSGLSCQ